MKMLLWPMSRICLVVGVLISLISGVGRADEPAEAGKTTVREAMREERPEDSRGWMVVSKQSYWPLCYESLDRIEEASKLFGSEDRDELADALEKCQAWLRLAASAAMTDGNSGVVAAADLYALAAKLVRKGDGGVTQQDLNHLTTLGLLCIAKSHVLRAAGADLTFKADFKPGRTDQAAKKLSAEVEAVNREIAAARVKRLREQYRYDAVESRKHLVVAQTYLIAAAESGGFKLDPALTMAIPVVPTTGDLEEYVDDELRARVTSMLELIEPKREALNKALEAALDFS